MLDPSLSDELKHRQKLRSSPSSSRNPGYHDPTVGTSTSTYYDEFITPAAPNPSFHRSSLSLSDLYANPTHAESVRSTYQHEWSSRSQTGERETADDLDRTEPIKSFAKVSDSSTPGSFPKTSAGMESKPYSSPGTLHQFAGFPQSRINSLDLGLNTFHPSPKPTIPSPDARGVYSSAQLDAEVEHEIGIANADGVFVADSHHPATSADATRGNFHDAGSSLDVTGFEGMDFTSFAGFDFNSSPTHLDLLQLLASDGSLAFGHTLIPQFHTYTRRNSPVLESTVGSTFELGESAFPGTQLARHPHMEIDVNAWAPDAGRPATVNPLETGNLAGAAGGGGDLDLSQFGVSTDIAHFWSSLMGHGHVPGLQASHDHGAGTVDHAVERVEFTNPSPFAGTSRPSGPAPHSQDPKGKQDATGKGSLSMDTPSFLSGSSGRPQEAINEARCLITDLVSAHSSTRDRSLTALHSRST